MECEESKSRGIVQRLTKARWCLPFCFFPPRCCSRSLESQAAVVTGEDIFKRVCIQFMIQRFIYKTVDFGTPSVSTAEVSHVRGR